MAYSLHEGQFEFLQTIRHHLHQYAELSGHEESTTEYLKSHIHNLKNAEIIEPDKFHGFIVKFEGDPDKPSVGFRCDIDALPIEDDIEASYTSITPGVGHKCGHDGHATWLLGMAMYFDLQKNQPKGTRWLIFQPSEENGQGAKQMVSWMKEAGMIPDYLFGFHNIPGFPLGELLLKNSTFCLASTGLVIRYTGISSHAAEPEKGTNPTFIIGKLLAELEPVSFHLEVGNTRIITPIHTCIGQVAFGTNPGDGVLMLTVRASTDALLSELMEHIREKATMLVTHEKIKVSFSEEEYFPATINHQEAFDQLSHAVEKDSLPCRQLLEAMRWSEDFGHYATISRACYFGIGSGLNNFPLHHPKYDFPDDLLPHALGIGVRLSELIA